MTIDLQAASTGSLVAPPPSIVPQTPPLAMTPRGPLPTPFTPRLMAGLVGVLLVVLASGFNEHVTDIDLADLRGVFGISYDDGTWLTAIYEAFQVSAMAFAPWCAVTFSLRRFTLTMAAGFCLLALIMPFAPNLPILYELRALQGFAAGALPPMLMTVALRFLPPKIKVYGLGAYALTATCGPNLATPLAAFYFETMGWHWVYWEPIPLTLLAMGLVAWGIPQDPLRLERIKQFDWRGVLLGFPAISFLVVALMQGDRLDWFNSPLITSLMIAGPILLALFLINEWHHPLPFFRIQMLRMKNLSFALISLAFVLVLAVSSLQVPSIFLAEVQGYRPLQTAPLALLVAGPQFVSLPLVSALCNIPRVDCRYVMAAGILLMLGCALGETQVTSAWYRGNYELFLALQIFGEPMAVLPILMLATLKLNPMDGPFVSGMFNMVKGFANVLAVGLISVMMTWREHFHSNVLLDHYGDVRLILGTPLDLAGFAERVRVQALTLTVADAAWAMALTAMALMILLIAVPERVYPPSTVLKLPGK